MKIKSWLIAWFLGVAPLVASEPAALPANASPADRAFAEIKAIVAEKKPADAATPSQQLQWSEAHAAKLTAAVDQFLAAYPTDGRRWDAFMWMRDLRPEFVTAIKPGYNTSPIDANLELDSAARIAWDKKIARLTAAMKASPDATAGQRERLEVRELSDKLRELRSADHLEPAVVDAAISDFESRHPDSPAVINLRLNFGHALEETDSRAAQAYYQRLTTDKNERLRAAAVGRLNTLAAKAQPMELKFTAVDGRVVDLAALRGKVVLLDFWATWCGPCKAELPNVIANYRKYHDRGFEIIGISLENAQLAPGDTPEAAAAKLQRARKVLADFTAKNGMPWPQYFDGKYWANDAARQFGVTAIPAVFLLDQEGRIVTTDARGPRLEEELKRLLGR